MPLAIVGVLVVISGASVVMASLKLRQRNLGPILDANGWAVNGRVKVNIPFGGALTKTAHLPKGSVRLLKDPYAATSRKAKVAFWTILLALAPAAVTSYILWDKRDFFSRRFPPKEIQRESQPGGDPPSPTAPGPA